MIETWLLENILAFKECGTISGAAEKLHITQPSVSRALQKLEQELHLPLLTRGKNKAALNDNGLLVADYAERILRLEEEMVQRVQAQEKANHTFSVGSCAPGPRLKLMLELPRLYPELNLEFFTSADEEKLLLGLLQDEYQLVILSSPLEHPDLICHFYLREQLYICVNTFHPLAMAPGVTFKDIDGQNFIMHANVGIWQTLLDKYAPHIKLFKEDDLDQLSILERSSYLPSFSSNYTQQLMPDRWQNRVHVPITDEDATQQFYLVYKPAHAKKLNTLT